MDGQQMAITPKRGEIYLVNFDPAIGAEIKKTRPALIVQNDIANYYSPITIVAAITSQFDMPLYPTEVLLLGQESSLRRDSVALLNQIRSIDRTRLVKRVGKITAETMVRIDQSLRASLALADFK